MAAADRRPSFVIDMKQKTAKRLGRLSSEDISLFCMQVALVLKSAIPLQDGLSAIAESLPEGGGWIVKGLEERYLDTGSFSLALDEAGFFPDYMVHMVEIGEKAGKLEDVMESLGAYYDRDAQLKKQIRSAVLYPMVSVLLMAAVIAVLVIKVLPIFQTVFESLGTGMTGGTILKLGFGFGVGALVFLCLVILLAAATLLLSRSEKGRQFLGRVFARFGPSRNLSRKVCASRFASVLSMLLSSGYHTEEALELIPSILPDPVVAGKVKKVQDRMQGGESLADAILEEGIFPGLHARMVGIGFRTGALDEVMVKLAAIYEGETDDAIQIAVGSIEPVMVGILSIVIGAILLSVMLPLLGIMSAIG